MAKTTHRKKRLVWPALLVAILALVWLAQDMKLVQLAFSAGPLAVLAAALAMLIYEYGSS